VGRGRGGDRRFQLLEAGGEVAQDRRLEGDLDPRALLDPVPRGDDLHLQPRPKLATDTDVFGTATAAQPPAATVSPSTADEIAKLATLRDSGAITPAEFDAAKAKALA